MQRSGAEGERAFRRKSAEGLRQPGDYLPAGAAFNRRTHQGIDVYSKELILQWLLKINKEYHTTLMVASGELEELLRICDRIA